MHLIENIVLLVKFLVVFAAQMFEDGFWVAYGLVTLPLRMILGAVFTLLPQGAEGILQNLNETLSMLFMGVGPRLEP